MGSIITRTFNQRDRRARVQANQEELRGVIKVMCSSLLALPIFTIGFLATPQDFNGKHIYEYMIIAVISCLLMNASNPSLFLLVGWLMIMIRTLFMDMHASFFYNIGCFLTTLSILTKLFDYFTPTKYATYYKYAIPSAFVLLASLFIKIGHCCSQFMVVNSSQKVAQTKGGHAFGIRLLVCILQLMIIVLTLMGHQYIRGRKFIPLSVTQQFNFLFSVRWTNYVLICLHIMTARGMLMMSQNIKLCQNGSSIFLHISLSLVLLIGSSALIYGRFCSQSMNLIKMAYTILTILLYATFIISTCFGLELLIHYSALALCLLSVIEATNQIQNQLRVNYVISFVVAIIFQALNQSYVPTANTQYNIIITSICLLIAIVFPYAYAMVVKTQNKYQHIFNSQTQINNYQ